ncbi:protein NLRC5-like [Lytechinus variegatus]|uniref:protein NLRC5-like n=1 Tax=Lytechinus variegatus TaxID=7654 RepID=UPI001BB26E45|nr:protein NLRC5-like [Lytechinus variegatus]
MATHGGITDDLLSRLAEDIETDEQMEALGRSLGLSHPAIRRYTETNRLEGRVTCRGTRDMLFDWRQTVVPADQHPRLKQALIDAHLVMLAETHLEGASSTPDIFGKKISESLTVGQCRDKLRHRYLDKLCKIQLKPWDKSNYAELKDLHTVVTMMRKDSSGKDTKNKEELEGSVDKIFSTKVNGRLPSRILISAPAGVGKTTAVAKIAYDWAEEKRESALEHLPLLFVVKFRNTSHRTSIGEAIKTQLLSDVDDLTPEGIESFIRRNQGICHIILDGLDEYAGISSTSNIVSVIRSEEFPESRILVTTRPHLESYFNQDYLPRVYTKMWIEGFSMESSREYIDRFFTRSLSDEKGGKLKEYLNDQPLIDELVKTPLFCLMICHLWSEDQLGSYVSTQTDLFDSVNKFLMHHANARSGLTFTQEKLKGIVNKIGKVALYGLLDDAKKLIFTPQDFRRVPRILDKACDLGIISKTTVPITNLPQSDQTTSTQIEFYHKLAQEHSAGKFIASVTWRILFWLRVSKLDRILWKINSNIEDYEQLIRFTAGIDRHLGIRIMEALLRNEHLEENERYRILLDCSSESKDSGGDMSSLVQRCVTAQSIILRSPTMFTVVGLEKLPKQLQLQVRTMRFVESVLTADVTRRMWSCLKLFPSLNTINITDSSLSFPSSLPKLSSFTNLSADKMTPSCYQNVLSSLPNARDLNVSIAIEDTSNTFEITTDTKRMKQIVYRQHDINTINVTLQQCVSQSLGEVNDLGLKSGRLALLFEDHSRNQHLLSVSGDMGRYGGTMVDLFVKTTQRTYIHST